MRNVILAAEWVAQRMYRRGAGSRNRKTAVVCRNLHPVLLFHCLRVIAGLLDVIENQIQTLERIDIAERIRLIAGKALNAVRKRINAGRRRNGARQILNHSGIEYHIVRNHILVDNADFEFPLWDRDDGIRRDLRTGSRSGRNQDNRNTLLRDTGRVEQFLNAVVIGHKHARKLCGVHHGTAAAGHNKVRA